MSLPASWVDRIFTRLTLVFGRDFMARYDGLEIDDVKAEWGEDLAGFQQAPDAIRYALENIPSDKPPTSLQFRDLCRRAPQYAPKALPAPPPDPTLAQELRRAFKPVTGMGDRSWAAKLRARVDAKETRPTQYQVDALAEMERRA
jgi:hypothetical protein